MFNRAFVAGSLFATIVLSSVQASAGVILITQTKAVNGGVTPDDAPGFPITLSRAGLYRFDSDLVVTADKVGIKITEPGVTIDLNGFRLSGGGTAVHGISGDKPDATIQNGTITNFKVDGIHGTGYFWIIENMRVTGNGRDGVSMYPYARILNNTVSQNGNFGIRCSSCLVADNMVSLNAASGISALLANILGNLVLDNAGYGILANGGTGFGNNTAKGNNGGDTNAQIFGVSPLHPNVCVPAC